jgi:tetratricopeptide (TPR) repeat protein
MREPLRFSFRHWWNYVLAALILVGLGAWRLLGLDGRLAFLGPLVWLGIGKAFVPEIIHEHAGFLNRWVWHDYRKANHRYRQAVDTKKATPEAYCALASLSFAEGDYSDAEKLLKKASLHLGWDPNLHLMFSKCLTRMGRLDEAMSEAVKFNKASDNVSVFGLAIGDVLKEQGDTVSSAAAYQEALQKDPQMIDCLLGLAEVYFAMGKTRDAWDEVNKALKLDPKNSDALFWAGKISAARGKARESSAMLQKSLNTRSIDDKSHRVPYGEVVRLLAEVRSSMVPLEKAVAPQLSGDGQDAH